MTNYQLKTKNGGFYYHIKKYIHLALVIFSLLFIVLPCLAQEIPVNIKADKLKYVEGSSIIKASGSVEVRLKKMVILADRVVIDSQSQVTTAEGQVRLFSLDYSAAADRLTYDLSSEVSSFKGFSGVTNLSKLKGPLFLSAQDLTDKKSQRIGAIGRLTTCNYRQKHYFAVASRLELYPNDKLIAYNVTLFVGQTPVLWLPIFYYDLSDYGQRNWEIGSNPTEGDYIKSTWGTPYGLLYLDQMSKKGFGFGLKNYYGLAALGLGAGLFYFYHVDEQDTGSSDWVTKIDHTLKLDDYTQVKLKHDYISTYLIPSGRSEQTSFDLNLNHNKKPLRWDLRLGSFDNRLSALQKYNLGLSRSDKKSATNYYLNYDFSKRSPNWARLSQRFYDKRPAWSDNVTLVTKLNYYSSLAQAGQPADEKLEPEISLHGREKDFTWRLTQNWYIDWDKDSYTADNNYQYLEKQPELEVTPRSQRIYGVNLKPSFGYGKYHEVRYVSQLGGNRDFTAERLKASLNADKTFRLNRYNNLTVRAGLDQFFYSPGDKLYAFRESMDLRTSLWGFFKNDIGYKKGQTDGNSPFLFDRLGTRYHNAYEKMTFYYLNKVNWTTSSGFNWQTGKWMDVMTNLRVSPDSRWYWNLRTGWDIENRRYKDMVNSLRFYPASFFKLNFASAQDLNDGSLKRASVTYDILFLEKQANQWKIRFDQIFDPNTQEFKVRNVSVVKDLHCWTLTYTYSDYRKQFGVTFSLKAMPEEVFGLSSGKGFYYEGGVERELKKLQQGKTIRRY